MKNRIAEKEKFNILYYQGYLNELYSDVNQSRSFDDLYDYLFRSSKDLCKALDRGTTDHSKLILPLSWLFSLSTKLEIDLQDSYCKKYPGICPNCLEVQCVCFIPNKMPSKHILTPKMGAEMYFRYETIKNTIQPYNLDKAVRNITEIFTVNQIAWHFNGPGRHIAKIYEEIAEIRQAISAFKKGEKFLGSVADEVADLFAWMIGVWGILFPNQSLDDAFVNYYLDGCPVCQSFPCKCDIYNDRPAGLVDHNRLTTITQIQQPVFKHYDIFLSYATTDKDDARKINSFLSKKKLKVFMSEKEIEPGSKWEDDIKNALKNSDLLCILATPNSLKSQWVTTEWGVAWVNDVRILPVLLQCSASDLPERLKAYQSINFHEMARIVEFLKK